MINVLTRRGRRGWPVAVLAVLVLTGCGRPADTVVESATPTTSGSTVTAQPLPSSSASTDSPSADASSSGSSATPRSTSTGAGPGASASDPTLSPGAAATGPTAQGSATSATRPATGGTTVRAAAGTLFEASMAGADGLVSNEWATYNPGASGAAVSSDWVVNSGSLFRRGGAGWTGVPDDATPDTRSASGTNSAVFRLYTRRSDFGDVRVQLDLRSNALTTTASTPAVAWDGVHIFLRYQSQYQLYYASVNRRDGHLVVKKKCQGGTENGGTYYELGAGEVSGHPIPFGSWQRVGATVRNLADGSVAITLQREGTTLLTVTDTGVGCAPIRAAGAVGLRGDNDDFEFTNVTVSAF